MSESKQAWACARPRPVLRLVPPLAPEPLPPPGERVLVATQGFRLTSERLEAHGRSYRLEDIRGVSTRHAAPRLLPTLALGLAAVLAEPVLLLQPPSLPVSLALLLATALVFASIVRLLLAADTWWLSVCTAEGERQVLRCQDHQLFTRVQEALQQALAQARPPSSARARHPLSPTARVQE